MDFLTTYPKGNATWVDPTNNCYVKQIMRYKTCFIHFSYTGMIWFVNIFRMNVWVFFLEAQAKGNKWTCTVATVTGDFDLIRGRLSSQLSETSLLCSLSRPFYGREFEGGWDRQRAQGLRRETKTGLGHWLFSNKGLGGKQMGLSIGERKNKQWWVIPRLRVMTGLKRVCGENHSWGQSETNRFRVVKLSLVCRKFKSSVMLIN